MNGSLTARGRGTAFFVVAAVLVLFAGAMPAGLHLTGARLDPSNVLKIWGLVLALALFLCAVGAYYRSRRLTLDDSTLRFKSLFHDESWPLAEVASLSYQLDLPVNEAWPESYIALWDGRERLLTRVSLRGWELARLQELFRSLLARSPGVSVAPEVRRFLDSEGARSAFF